MNKFSGHILVVDDDDGIRDLVKQYLSENNFLITTAKNAEEAKEKISIIKFDLIVLDIMMPGKTGLEFTLENKDKINTPIILLTAKGEAIERIKGLEVGADDYLPKPFEPKELILRIKNILNKTKSKNQKKIIEFDLDSNGLLTNLIAFNIGVEIGQLLALSTILILISYWRKKSSFLTYAYSTNVLLMTLGFMLTGYQLFGYFNS